MNWRFKLSIRLALLRGALLAATTLAACSDHSVNDASLLSPSTTVDAAINHNPIVSLTLSPAQATIAIGGRVTLTPVLRDAAGSILTNRIVNWAVSGTVASVSATGVVTGLRLGTATVSGTNHGVSGFATVTVSSAPPVPSVVATVAVTPATITVVAGATTQLTAVARNAAGELLGGASVTWTTSAAARATVGIGGLVTAIAAGSATITATSGGKSGSAVVTVTSLPAPVPVISAATSQLTLAWSSAPAGGGAVLATLRGRDAAGNLMTTGGATVVIGKSGGTSGVAIGAVTDLGTGSYTAPLTPLVAGTATTLTATISGQAVTTTMPTFTVTSTPGGGAVTVTGLSRDAGSAAGGAALTITGTGFSGTPAVSFGGVAATNVVVVNSTTLTATAPAHAAGAVNIVVGGATLAQGFEYLPAPTITFASHDFEDGTLGGFGTNIASGTVAASTDRAYAGTRSAKSTVTGAFASSGAAIRYSFTGALSNPALSAEGVFMRWYVYVPTASVTAVLSSRQQIKLHLFRQQAGSGQPGWIMPGIGSDFPPGDGSFTAFIDNGILAIPGGYTGVRFGDGVWHEIQIGMRRSGGQGRARMWIDGRLRFDVTNAAMGTDNPGAAYYALFGVAYSQSAGPVIAYVDNITLRNGYIDP